MTDALTYEIGHSTEAVVKIHASQHGDLVKVWTVVEDFSSKTRDAVYDAEDRLREMHPETRFVFNMVELSDYSDSVEVPLAYAR